MKNLVDYFGGTTDSCRSSAPDGNAQREQGPEPLIKPLGLTEWKARTDKMINSELSSMEITVTFTNIMLNKYKKRYLNVMIDNIIKHTKNIRDYILIPDYSNDGRYHLHGVIIFNKLSVVNTLQRKLSKYIGRTEIRGIRHRTSYSEYIYKVYKTEPFNGNLVISRY